MHFHRSMGLALAFLAGPLSAEAAQIQILDTVFTHALQSPPQAYFPMPASAPANWKTPDDYAGGMAYFRLVVLDKPSASGIGYQICLEQDGRASGKRACAKEQALFDEGVYEWSQALAEWDQAAKLDLARKPQEQILILKDCFNVPVDPKAQNWVGSPYLTLYYPMQVRFSAALVTQGGTFSGWPTAIRGRAGKSGGPDLSIHRSGSGPGLEILLRTQSAAVSELRLSDARGATLAWKRWNTGTARTLAWSGEAGAPPSAGLYFLEYREAGRSWSRAFTWLP